VHISSGFAALAGALVLGRRLGYGKVPIKFKMRTVLPYP
jgi:Amt family ammonium transporter